MDRFLDLSHRLDLNLDFPLLFDLCQIVSGQIVIVRQMASIIRMENGMYMYAY